jgi:hypothetical protein
MGAFRALGKCLLLGEIKKAKPTLRPILLLKMQ